MQGSWGLLTLYAKAREYQHPVGVRWVPQTSRPHCDYIVRFLETLHCFWVKRDVMFFHIDGADRASIHLGMIIQISHDAPL